MSSIIETNKWLKLKVVDRYVKDFYSKFGIASPAFPLILPYISNIPVTLSHIYSSLATLNHCYDCNYKNVKE